MPSAARQPLYRPAREDSDIVFLRVGDPRCRGLRESYHDVRRALRRVEKTCDPLSLAQARRLNRARLILLDALVAKA
jgi:hypothetical protein